MCKTGQYLHRRTVADSYCMKASLLAYQEYPAVNSSVYMDGVCIGLLVGNWFYRMILLYDSWDIGRHEGVRVRRKCRCLRAAGVRRRRDKKENVIHINDFQDSLMACATNWLLTYGTLTGRILNLYSLVLSKVFTSSANNIDTVNEVKTF